MEMVKVTEILKNVNYSVDFGSVSDYGTDDDDDARTLFWQEVIRVKSSDTGFGALVNAILENGFDPDSPVGWEAYDGYINEGHHRIVAAILLCLDEVPATNYGGGTGIICAHDCACNGEDYDEGGFLGALDLN